MARKKVVSRNARRARRHLRVRKKVSGTADRPRLVVYRSLKHMEGQLVDDLAGKTLVGVSTRVVTPGDEAGKTAASREAGRKLAEQAKEAGIEKVVFDRGGYRYHGRVKAFADGARDGGLEF
jgi:large subunit ribosomal protein L18